MDLFYKTKKNNINYKLQANKVIFKKKKMKTKTFGKWT